MHFCSNSNDAFGGSILPVASAIPQLAAMEVQRCGWWPIASYVGASIALLGLQRL